MSLGKFGRRKEPKSIRELMKRGVDDPRKVPIPVPDNTPGPVNPIGRGQLLVEARTNTSFVGRSRARSSTTISGSSSASFTNTRQGFVASWVGSASVRPVGRARKVSTFTSSGGSTTVTFRSTSTSPISRLLMESDSYVLQESDDRILLESTSQNAVLMESGSYVLREDNGRITLEDITPPPEEPPPGSPLLDLNGAIILDVSGNTIFGV